MLCDPSLKGGDSKVFAFDKVEQPARVQANQTRCFACSKHTITRVVVPSACCCCCSNYLRPPTGFGTCTGEKPCAFRPKPIPEPH